MTSNWRGDLWLEVVPPIGGLTWSEVGHTSILEVPPPIGGLYLIGSSTSWRYLCNYANWMVHTCEINFTVIPPLWMICNKYHSLKSRTPSNDSFKELTTNNLSMKKTEYMEFTTNNLSMKKTECMSFIIYRFSSADQIWIHFFHCDN